jgi:hypothetical protein
LVKAVAGFAVPLFLALNCSDVHESGRAHALPRRLSA